MSTTPNQHLEPAPEPGPPDHEPFLERHYTVQELATAWSLSKDTIRRLFESELGVIAIVRPRRGKRVYKTLRIPASVAERVYRKLTNGNGHLRRTRPH